MFIDVYSHCIKVSKVLYDRDLNAMLSFCRPLVEMGFEKRGRKFIPVPARTFASATRDRREFRFHRNQFADLIHHLKVHKGFRDNELTITHHTARPEDYPRFDFKIQEMHSPRENQPEIISYVLDDGDKFPQMDPIIKMVTLQTGKGKTFIAQYCMKELRSRTAIHFKGGYTERWKGDLLKTFKFKKGEFLIVRGLKDMVNLQHMAIDGTLEAMVIIISVATMREYIKHFEEGNGKSATYPIHPGDFYPRLGISLRITDELHQEFHTNYKIDLYTHVPKSLGLSATMVASDPFKNKMYEIAYPARWRHDGGGYDAFIGVKALTYTTQSDVNLKYMGGQGYSHTTYEESIMKYPDILASYLKIIERTVFKEFISVFESGQKMLIFCARVEFCTLLVDYLRQRHPSFEIVRYVGSENDSYDDLLDSDIGVTTVGSGGTAIDVVNLVGSLMTTAIDSRQSNEQVLGRTRRIRDWPEMTPWFIYMVNTAIEQHVKYHHNKKDFFKGKVVFHNEVRSTTNL